MKKQQAFSKVLCVALLLALLLPGAGASQAQKGAGAPLTGDYVLGEVLVKFRPGVMPVAVSGGVETGVASLDALARQYGITSAKPLFADVGYSAQGLERIYKLSLPATANVLAVAGVFGADAYVEYAEPNYVYHILGAAPAAKDARVGSQTPFDWPSLTGGMRLSQPHTGPRSISRLLIDDHELVLDPHLYSFDVHDFLARRSSILSDYVVDWWGQTLTAPVAIETLAYRYSVSPKVLLVLIEMQTGLVTARSASRDLLQAPLGDLSHLANHNDSVPRGFTAQLDWAASTLADSYDSHRMYVSSDHLILADGQRVDLDASINPGSYAVQFTLAQILGKDAWYEATAPQTGVFSRIFQRLLGSPTNAPLYASVSEQTIPDAYLPWEAKRTWTFIGGPHPWGSSPTWSAVDFASPDPQGCDGTPDYDDWIVAARGGTVVHAEGNLVVIEHVDGWSTGYFHVGSDGMVSTGSINRGERIGHPSCEGGSAYGDHVHFDIRRNGERIAISGTVLSGWTIHNGSEPYLGYMSKSGEPNCNVGCQLTSDNYTSDPKFARQWGLHNTGQTGGTEDADIDAPEAWAVITGTTDVMVAVIDTGVDYTHDDLDDGRVRTDIDKDYVNNDNDAMDDHGHGTHVAGIIAAETNNGIGVAGVMWQAQILPLKVCNSRGSCAADDVASAIRYAADQEADVINMSLGGSCSQTIADAVNYAYFDKDVVIVAAAGNSGYSISYPAKHAPVIAVGATDRDDKRAYFSSRGAELDVMAPGVGIWSTVPDNDYDDMKGTSMASPHAAGVAGLLLTQRPTLTNTHVAEILRQSADDLGQSGFDRYYGYGRVNAFQALQTPTPDEAPVPERAKCSGCAASAATLDMPSRAETLQLLWRLHTEVLIPNPVGQEYAALFFQYSPEVSGILFRDATLRAATQEVLVEMTPILYALLTEDEDVVLTADFIAQIKSLTDAVAAQASTELRNDLQTHWRRVAPEQFVGMTATEAWAVMQRPYRLYLPIVVRSH